MKNDEKRVKTKIVATLGPASDNYEIIKELAIAGTTMFRINTSHGTIDEHKRRIETVRKIEKELDRYLPILIDLQGPKIRVGNMPNSILINKDDELTLRHGDKYSDKLVPVDYKGINNDVKQGDKILLDDGKVGLEVLSVVGEDVNVKVLYGSEIKQRKGINLPGTTASLSAVTQRDIDYIKFAVDMNADYIALSFVRESADIELAKKYIKDYSGDIPIIAKIEKPQALENLTSIVRASDGIMVARGDLGIEMSPADVPIAQKLIIDEAITRRKVCIVATQMLESMIEAPIPTRAETSDVANAILDGTDAIMLSAETAAGKYPIEAVKMMRAIAKKVDESEFGLSNLGLEVSEDYQITPQAIANAAVQMAQDLNAKAILSFTHSGYTPRLLSKLRPSVPIIAISDQESTCRRLNLHCDITPFVKDWDTVLGKDLLEEIDKYILETTPFVKDDRIIIIGSTPKLITGRTNTIRVHRLGAISES